MNTLPKVVTRRTKRVGRGYGSGKGGHTSGRGAKGQKARSSVGILFEGVKAKKSLLRRLPVLRGKGKFMAKPKPVTVNLNKLSTLPEESEVSIDTLIKAGLVDARIAKANGIKILADGELKKKLTILLPTSAAAAQKVEKAGGSIKLG